MTKENSGAYFSLYRKYRYCLWRIWDRSKPLIMFIGLNPSWADEKHNDHTITRVINFATAWGYGGVYMLNLIPTICTDSKKLNIHMAEGVKAKNMAYLKFIGRRCTEVIFVWGKHKGIDDLSKEVLEMFPTGKALIVNKDGSPRHPLYIHSSVIPIPYESDSNSHS